MAQLPQISIIIPVYNRPHLIKVCLESINSQTYSNWECIVVDDASEDNTIEVIRDYCNADNRFKLHSNKRKKGAQGARNTGVELSEGNYLIFLDSDDLLSGDCLLNRIKQFEENPENDFLVFSTLEFKKDTTDTNILLNVNTTGDLIERFLNLDVPWITMAPIWKRASFLKLGEWNEEVLSWQDWELHIRAILNNYKFLYFSTVDNYLRRDPSIVTIGKNSLSQEHLQSHFVLIEQLENLMKENPRYISRLSGLAFWLAGEALKQGYHDTALIGFKLSHKNCHFIKKWVNFLGLYFTKKFIITDFETPNFGTMRKIYA